MTDKNSPLNKFYPNRFEIDVSGCNQLYQGIVLLPFIDETLLREEFEKVFCKLSDKEKEMNNI
jgi:5'-3' exonuclease